LKDLAGSTIAHTNNSASDRLPLIDLNSIDTSPTKRETVELGTRPQAQPGHEPRRLLWVIEARRLITDTSLERPAYVIVWCADLIAAG
jgi:hypothetical protein